MILSGKIKSVVRGGWNNNIRYRVDLGEIGEVELNLTNQDRAAWNVDDEVVIEVHNATVMQRECGMVRLSHCGK